MDPTTEIGIAIAFGFALGIISLLIAAFGAAHIKELRERKKHLRSPEYLAFEKRVLDGISERLGRPVGKDDEDPEANALVPVVALQVVQEMQDEGLIDNEDNT